MNDDRDNAAEAAAHQDQLERERALCDALDEAFSKGVSTAALKTLAFETGARWNAAPRRKAA